MRNAAPLVVLAIAGLALVAWLILRGGLGSSPLAAVPEDSFLVATLDVAALADSPLVEAFVDKDGKPGKSGKMLGVDALTDACGFNPLTRIRAIAVAVPEEGEGGEFGVIASGALTRDELTKCAQAMITRRGGEPKVGASGSFTVVEDARAGREAASTPRVAFRDGGPYLVGSGAWLDRMIATAEGRVPSVAKSPEHASLRASLASRHAGTYALVVSALLPKTLRDRLKSEMSEETGAHGTEAMAGVLGVASAGLAVHAGRRGEDAWIYAELRCEASPDCDEVAKLLARKRFGWSRDFGLRFAGLGPAIDSFESHPDPEHPSTLLVSTHLPVDAFAGALDYVLTPHARARPPASTSPATPPSLPLVNSNTTPKAGAIPDEVIHPGKSADSGATRDGAKPAVSPTAAAGAAAADASATHR